MSKKPVWVDPPNGWRYGFPKIWYPDKDPMLIDWLIANGMPPEYEFMDFRMWNVEENDDEDPT